MEERSRGKSIVYGPVATEMKEVGKRSLEWDLNDWKWDGNLFQASPLNPGAYDYRRSQCFPAPELRLAVNTGVSNATLPFSEEANPISDRVTRESEKKRRVGVVHDDEELNNETGLLNLKLGEQVFRIGEVQGDKGEGKVGKNSKNGGTSYPVCQVEGCTTDLRNARDYNRRHNVCEVHSKSPEAVVGNVVQRFCQQCSRFHALEEFDGDKRSCRKRLAGHNKRRRKAHPEATPNVGSLTDGINTGQIINLLLRVLSNMHTSSSNQANDQDLLPQILQNLATFSNGSHTSRLLQGSQGSPELGTSYGIQEQGHSNQEPSQTTTYAQMGSLTRENQSETRTTSVPQPKAVQAIGGTLPTKGTAQEPSAEKYIDIDLNTVCNDDSQDCVDDLANGIGSVTGTYWAEQALPSPPLTGGNSGSTSGQSNSSSSEAQGRTGRIVFKLFDKDPNDMPSELRTQILDWLSQTPTDLEGYIRPGCIILTLYLHLNRSIWEQLCYDVSSSLSRLLDMSNDPFWNTGWIYARIQQRAAFICDGRVILDASLPSNSPLSRISSISPIALPAGQTVKLVVRGSNLAGPTSRLLCAIEGRYLIQENCYSLVEDADICDQHDEIQSLTFSCSVPNILGRGFVEVEDYDFTGCFFPFIVAEPEICHELCMLEREMEVSNTNDCNEVENGKKDAKYKALDFVHEMGWLLNRNSVRPKKNEEGSPLNVFAFERLKWLVEFSMDHDWCAVLRKLLDILFSGIIDIGDYITIEDGLADIALLHTAVRRNSRPMVEFLLMYVPNKKDNRLSMEKKKFDHGPTSTMLFRPDMAGIGGLTPLHIAASSAGSDSVLDALLEDPGKVGIEAWKTARDSTGLTPCDYASLRGHYRYLHLVQKKLNQKSSDKHVLLYIPSLSRLILNQTQTDKLKSTEFDSFYTEKPQLTQSCKLCDQMADYRFGSAPLTFRPLMMSLVAVAVVCVCTALLFKSEPHVSDIFGPFRWESLKFGAM